MHVKQKQWLRFDQSERLFIWNILVSRAVF